MAQARTDLEWAEFDVNYYKNELESLKWQWRSAKEIEGEKGDELLLNIVKRQCHVQKELNKALERKYDLLINNMEK